jgi:5-methylcytosine-specific restriction protein A
MAKEWAKKFYNSKAWELCRDAYISYRITVDGGMCETCKEELGYIVHHKEKLTVSNINNPEVTLNHSKLRYDCLECHNVDELGEHSGKVKEKKRYMFDSDGNVIPIVEVD